MVKEHGLLFKAAMVRALLEGRKTETRRPVALHNTLVWDELRQLWHKPKSVWDGFDWEAACPLPSGLAVRHVHFGILLLVPRIEQGHRIWARETWWRHPDGTICFRADQSRRNAAIEAAAKKRVPDQVEPWSSPIHLQRVHARIVLDVTVHPFGQRIGMLTPEQVLAEGFPLPESDAEGPASFGEYWQRIHGAWTPELLTWCYPGLRRVQP